MSQVIRTAWDKRSRLNVDSDLEFDSLLSGNGTLRKQAQLNVGNNWWFSDFAIFFTVEFLAFPSSASHGMIYQTEGTTFQGLWIYTANSAGKRKLRFALSETGIKSEIETDSILETNRKYNIVCVKVGNKASAGWAIYINGIKQVTTILSDQDISTITVTANTIYISGVGSTANIGWNHSSLSNFIVATKNPTQKEISYVHANGGILPESTHQDCISHHPLQTAYKAGTNYTPNAVEQYNYAKVTPLTANHGALLNYTDDELGLGADFDNNTAIKDFYDKVDFQDVQFELPIQANYEDNVEVASGLKPKFKALPISTGQDITFGNVGTIKGITFFIKTATDNIELFELISGDANSKISIVAGAVTFGSSFANVISLVNGFELSNADIGKQLNLNTLNVVSIFFDNFNATNLITKFTDGSYLASVLLFDKLPELYKKTSLKICNNTLYKNLSIADQRDIKYGWNFNESSFSGNIDLASDIGTLTASVNGFADLNTLIATLTPITDLR